MISGLVPATFTVAEDNRSYDLSGQTGPLMEILQILKANGIGMNNMIDLRNNPAARQQVQAVVRRAAAQQTPAAPASGAAPSPRRRPLSTWRRRSLLRRSGFRNWKPCARPVPSPTTSTTPSGSRSSPNSDSGQSRHVTSTEERTEPDSQKVSLPTLTAMVVGSMIGSGVFLLPRRFGTETGVLGAIIAWTIAGTGMLMLAFVFQRLATRKPDLDAGIFAYAKAGFGDYVGFNSAIGYWASACAGNTSYWVLITATMSAVVPAFGAGDTVLR